MTGTEHDSRMVQLETALEEASARNSKLLVELNEAYAMVDRFGELVCDAAPMMWEFGYMMDQAYEWEQRALALLVEASVLYLDEKE